MPRPANEQRSHRGNPNQDQPSVVGAPGAATGTSIQPAARFHFHTRAVLDLFPVPGRSGASMANSTLTELRIEGASIGTGIKMRDSHLRSNDYFHARTYRSSPSPSRG